MDPPSASSAPLRATWMGVSTLLFTDGNDSFLIDGFFTRPSYVSFFLGKVGPDEKIVAKCLQKASIGEGLRAVLVTHSHFDHVLDSPAVCKLTGAKLVGSDSSRMVAKGYGLPDEQIIVPRDGDVMQFGAFRVTIIEGIHSPGDIAPGDITEPLAMPCSFRALKSGKCYSYLIKHGDRRVFVHPSANFVPDKFKGINASTIFLGVGLVGKQTPLFREEYWNQVVGMLGPSRIVPIHWDNFWISLDSPLTAMPWWADKWLVTQKWLQQNCKAAGVELQMLKAWEVIDL